MFPSLTNPTSSKEISSYPMPSKEIRFTIAIIHRNNIDRLKKVIQSAVDCSRNDDEIIIIDNASTDRSGEMISALYPDIEIITNHCNAGYGYCCNQAMRKGEGKYFLLCNNDIVLPSNCLNQFEHYFSIDSNAGMIGPQLLTPEGELMNSFAPPPSLMSQVDLIGRLTKREVPSTFHKVGVLRGACLAIRRDTVEKTGMYDEDFYFYHEETVWCVRMDRMGWDVMFAPDIRIRHVGGASTSSVYAESRIEFFRSRLLYWKKVFPLYQVFILYLWNIPKLLIDFTFYFASTILTLNLNKRLRKKLIDRAVVIAWLALGQPENWGLPNKCPKQSRS